jgi:hypothetical protein
MSSPRINAGLVAAGYDKNRNGIVEELRNDAQIDSNGDGQIQVAELAAALASDSVVISGGYISAKAPGKPVDMPEIRTMASIHEISKDYSLFGSPQYPGWKYQETRSRQDGSTYTVYHWREAISELQAKLQAIRAVAGNQNDFRSKTIASMADTAIRQNFWAEFLDEGSSRSRYSALYVAVQSINQMSEVPPQPIQSVDGMAGAVNGAKGAVDGLRSTMKDPGVMSAEAKTQAKAAEFRQKAQNIPWWHFLLIFGFFEKSGLNNKAKKVEEQLAVLKAANPDSLELQLSETARKAYETSQQSWVAKNIDDAQALANAANPIAAEAGGISKSAQGQASKIQELLKTISQ